MASEDRPMSFMLLSRHYHHRFIVHLTDRYRLATRKQGNVTRHTALAGMTISQLGGALPELELDDGAIKAHELTRVPIVGSLMAPFIRPCE